MKKKKIKYDVAKNGEEAVQKWNSGGFHLILVHLLLVLGRLCSNFPVKDGYPDASHGRYSSHQGDPANREIKRRGRIPVDTSV